MAIVTPRGSGATHDVPNQSRPLEGYNVFEADRVLVEALRREGADWAVARGRALGQVCGRRDVIELGRLANEKSWSRTRFASVEMPTVAVPPTG